MKLFNRTPIWMGVVAVVSATASIPSLAQDSDKRLEEVIVTTQMREQKLLEVPVSVTALDGDFLSERSITDFKEAFAYTTGVSGMTNDSFFDSVSVRGVSNNGFGTGSDPAIGIFLNNVYQSRTGAVPTMYDLAGLEVVKGPQGTLFGRNSASGAMSMTTVKPGDTTAGNVAIEYNSMGQTNLEAAFDAPLTDNLSMRIAGFYDSEDGYIDNLAGGRDLGESNTAAARATFVYTPTDHTEVIFMAQYEDRDSDGTLYRAVDTMGAWDQVDNDQVGTDESNITDLNLTINIELGSTLFSSITGYKDHDYYYAEDFDGTGELLDVFTRDQSGSLFSQEFRLSSDGSTNLNWVVGASYYTENLDAHLTGQTTESALCNTIFQIDYEIDDRFNSCSDWESQYPVDWDDAIGAEFEPTENGKMVEDSFTEGNYDGWGVFANVDYRFYDHWLIGAGIRYTRDNKQYDVDNPWPDSYLGTWNYMELYTDGPINDQHDWDNVSGRVSLSYMPNDDITVYGTVSTGYKSGGYNYMVYDLAPDYDIEEWEWTVDNTVASPSRFNEETITNYELGIKSILLDGTMSLNASLFSYTYEDLQQMFYIEGSGGNVTRNVGEVDGQGAEIDLNWNISDNWNLILGLATLDTDFSDAPVEFCEDCSGNEMPFAPAFSSSTILTYSSDFGGRGAIDITAEYLYTDQQWADLDNTEEVQLDSRSIVNLRAKWTAPSEGYAIIVYGNNLTDEKYYNWGYAEDGWLLGATQTDPARGAAYGIRLEANY